ncbi:hypothetical protein [Fuscibacter oryzae]|uniref:Type IV pilus biogenesis protein PilP n=1 Tax=Fuscibacter oryzae TaxID=2803939 RepID=A0A8J7SRF4_9RHOB|nr:hypothetical protein [Fuscibacter oryzae]MBL4927576.1 hypothetical protein [Fuscibacter oryzae]
MKPAFALDLRDDAIGLLHRSGPTWQQVGGVAMDEPDLTGALSYLRATALGLSPRGITTKLVIPNDQILYTTVSAPGPDDESRRSQIRAALDGRTPYAPEDLVFDWSGTGDEVQVAVVARETLDEAEGFAARHRFNPIAFVAVPEADDFAGEPWFGPSALSVSLLSGIEKVERDNLPVLDIRRNFEPELEAEDDAQVAPLLIQPEYAPSDDVDAVATPALQEAVSATAEGDPEAEPDFDPAPMEDPSLPDEVAPLPEEAPQQPEPEVPPPADPVQPPAQKSLPAETLSQAIRPLLPPIVEEAPMALDVMPEEEGPARPSVINPAIPDDVPPMPGLAAAMAFSSRRAPDVAAATSGRIVRPTVTKPAVAKPLAASKGFAAEPGPAQRPAVSAAPATAAARNGRVAPAKNGLSSLDSSAAKGKKSPTEELSAASTAGASAVVRPTQAKPVTGLSGRAVAPPRKSRHMGLILTGILLLFLALVAAWSSIFLASSDDPSQPEAVQTASATPDVQPTTDPADATPPDQSTDLPTAEDEALADLQDPASGTDQATPAVTEPAPLDPAPAAAQSADAAPTATAPTGEQAQDEIFLATMDAAPKTPDPSALPDPEARGDSLPLSQAAPPPFGTTYQFDAAGLIKPTPDGIITPEGITLVAGKPPLLPKPRPAALAAAALAVAAAPAVEAAVAAVAAETPFPSDPALAGAKPRSRPASLALPPAVTPDPATAPKPDDGAALAPAADVPPGPRPLARPAALAAAVPPATDASAASLAANIDADSISPLAIAISRRPAARPSGLNSAVEAAVAEANRPEARPETPAPEPEVKLAAAPVAAPESNVRLATPEADSEPEAASAAPSIPTRASVAKQATLKNAFDLGKTNLIGVYGTPSKRYALVRTSSGSFKKVKPGDRIDGGKVVSIGDDSLRVQKGGRTVVLALPKT